MGVSGAGKSTLGSALAKQLDWDFIEGDDYHSKRNIEKMRTGHALSDSDRRPWLIRLHQLITSYTVQHRNAVLTCSTLKKDYRDVLGHNITNIRYAYLCGEVRLFRERLKSRGHHYMPSDLLDSQIKVLEPPEDALLVPMSLPTDEQIDLLRQAWAV